MTDVRHTPSKAARVMCAIKTETLILAKHFVIQQDSRAGHKTHFHRGINTNTTAGTDISSTVVFCGRLNQRQFCWCRGCTENKENRIAHKLTLHIPNIRISIANGK